MTASATPGRTLRERLFAPVDPASLAVVRIAFGALMVVEVVRFFALDWIREDFVAPPFHFTYLGFGWVRPWPGNGMYVHCALIGIAALGMALGWRYRVAAAVFTLGFAYVFLLEKARYLNHFYLILLLGCLFALVPAERAFSLDARRRRERRPVPAWCVHALRAQLGLVYFFAGVAKLNGDWLRGEPIGTWLAERADHPFLGPLLASPWAPWFFAYGGLLLDLLAWPLLAWKRSRGVMFLIVTAFHAANALIFGLGIFPWLMIPLTTIFFEPDWPRRLARSAPPVFEPIASAPAARRAVLAFLGAWFLLQILLPLRHFLYPGSVHWTEEGHRFAWHMKLRDKEGTVTFLVTDPRTGGTRQIWPIDELSARQVRKMSGSPDMILQYAHHLADTRSPPGTRLEVRALARCSLNFRAPQVLVDPDVDLAAQARGLGPACWIVPLGAAPSDLAEG